MTVIIGVDPHQASHTAVATGADEGELGMVSVRATRQAGAAAAVVGAAVRAANLGDRIRWRPASLTDDAPRNVADQDGRTRPMSGISWHTTVNNHPAQDTNFSSVRVSILPVRRMGYD